MSPELTHLDRAGHDGEPGRVHGGAHVEQHALVADVGETAHRGQPGAHLQGGVCTLDTVDTPTSASSLGL